MTKPLRILVVSLDYPPLADGGYGLMAGQVCAWLRRQGHALLVLTADDPVARTGRTAPAAVDGVPVRWTLRSYWDGEDCRYPPFREALAIEQANHAQLRQALADLHPDVVTFWHMGALSLGLITATAHLGLPLVCVIGDDWLCYGGWADAWLRRFSYHPQRAAAVARLTGLPTTLPDLGALGTFCFVSAFTQRRAEQVGGWRFRRAVVTPPGVDRALFPPLDRPPEHAWRWRLLWLGRVVGPKGVETAIRALGLLPREALLEIVGPVTPTYRAELEDLAASVGVAERLRFAHAPHTEVRTYYQASDVTLFTSAVAHEAFGLVPLEAMAGACPVVCTGVGGSGEYCHDGVNCLRVPPGEPAALATALQRLAAEPALRGRIVEGGLRTAAALTVERQARAIERCLYAEIASR